MSYNFADLPRGLPHSPAASGSAAREIWMEQATLENSERWRYSPDKIFLGETEAGTKLGFMDNRHILTVAGSRAGKGTSAILPNLALYEGSVMVLDPKGENASKTAERRGKGRRIPNGGLNQDVYVLDPFEIADVANEYRAGFDPMANLDPGSNRFVDDCGGIAAALIIGEAGKENDHWNGTAKLVLRGFIAWVAAAPGIKDRTLNEVRRLVHLPPDMGGENDPSDENSFDHLLDQMIDNPDIANHVPYETAAILMGMGDDERGSVLSTLRQNIMFLSSPQMADILSNPTRALDLEKWKFGGVSVYLCLPATYLHTHSRFFRLFIDRLLSAVELHKEEPDLQALMILDEMHVLGHMEALETAAGLIAGYGVKIWSIWQDFAQLQSIYKQRWESFLGNASIFQSFGLNDLTTLKYVSDRLGASSIIEISQSEQSVQQAAQGFTGQSRSIKSEPLLTPEEVAYHFSRQSENQLLIYTGVQPIHIRRVPFYDDYFKLVRIEGE